MFVYITEKYEVFQAMNGSNIKEAIDTGGEGGMRSESVLMKSYKICNG